MTLREPLTPFEVWRRIRAILLHGEVVWSGHASEEMGRDGLDLGGVVEPGELVSGTWRYRVRARNIWVVVAFRSESRLAIVTAWRTAR